jgi:hypothetical protein
MIITCDCSTGKETVQYFSGPSQAPRGTAAVPLVPTATAVNCLVTVPRLVAKQVRQHDFVMITSTPTLLRSVSFTDLLVFQSLLHSVP